MTAPTAARASAAARSPRPTPRLPTPRSPAGPTGTTNENSPDLRLTATEPTPFQCRRRLRGLRGLQQPQDGRRLGERRAAVSRARDDGAGNTDATPGHAVLRRSHAPRRTPRRPTRRSRGGRAARPTRTRRRSRSPPPRAELGVRVPRRRRRRGACTSPLTTAALADGAHSVSVRAIDAAGNIDPTPATRSFTVDTAPPATRRRRTRRSVGADGTDHDNTPTFGFTATEAGATFQCRVDPRRVRGAAPARGPRRPWPTARTASRSAPSTGRQHRPHPGHARLHRRHRASAGHDGARHDDHVGPDRARSTTRARRSPSRRPRPARRSSAASTPARGRLHEPVHDGGAGRRRAQRRGARHGRGRQHRRHAGHAGRSRSTPRRRRHHASRHHDPAAPTRRPTRARPDVRLHRDRGRPTFQCRVDTGACAALHAARSPRRRWPTARTSSGRATDGAGNIDAPRPPVPSPSTPRPRTARSTRRRPCSRPARARR